MPAATKLLANSNPDTTKRKPRLLLKNPMGPTIVETIQRNNIHRGILFNFHEATASTSNPVAKTSAPTGYASLPKIDNSRPIKAPRPTISSTNPMSPSRPLCSRTKLYKPIEPRRMNKSVAKYRRSTPRALPGTSEATPRSNPATTAASPPNRLRVIRANPIERLPKTFS